MHVKGHIVHHGLSGRQNASVSLTPRTAGEHAHYDAELSSRRLGNRIIHSVTPGG